MRVELGKFIQKAKKTTRRSLLDWKRTHKANAKKRSQPTINRMINKWIENGVVVAKAVTGRFGSEVAKKKLNKTVRRLFISQSLERPARKN